MAPQAPHAEAAPSRRLGERRRAQSVYGRAQSVYRRTLAVLTVLALGYAVEPMRTLSLG